MKKVLFFLALFLFASCIKKHVIHITAKNAVTGEPYAGLHYEVIREKGKVWEDKLVKVASGILDENGEAMVSKNIIKDPIRIMVERPPNWCYEKNNQYYLKGDGPNYEVNVEFAECAYLKQNISNVNCQGMNDYMILETSNEVNSLGKTGWEFFGCNGYVGDHFSSVPIGKYYFKWTVIRNNVSSTYYDTINLSEEEYKVYNINY